MSYIAGALATLIALVCSASIVCAQGAQEDTLTLGGRSVVVWQPARVAGVRQPVVVFSHGFGGCPTQSRFLTAGLAARGYWVFAPFHRDAGCGRKSAAAEQPRHRFGDPSAWGDLTYADRVDDVRAIVAALSAPEWSQKIDLTQLAVAGHSLGGYTALSVAGAWTLMRMPGIRAVLALAPYTTPFLVRGTLSEVTLPVMFQSGALDKSITAAIARPGGAYEAVRGPKFFVDFAGARHWSWGNKPVAAHDAMLSYAAAFLDRYVRGTAEDSALTTKRRGVVQLRFSRDAAGVAVKAPGVSYP